jgi:hypothetical protein
VARAQCLAGRFAGPGQAAAGKERRQAGGRGIRPLPAAKQAGPALLAGSLPGYQPGGAGRGAAERRPG